MSEILQFVEKVDIMKPNSVAKDNLKSLAKLDKLLDDPNYAADEKIDGCRYKLIACRFFSKENVEKTDNYPHLRDFFVKLGMPNLILDGEINYPGRTSQYCTRVTGADPATAISFQQANGLIHFTMYDMLRTPKGSWLLNYSYAERRKILEYFYKSFIVGTPLEEHIHISNMEVEKKRDFLDKLINSGHEGIVLKKLNSMYLMGKKPMWEWMKIKQEDETDLVIVGFEDPKVEYSGSNFDGWPFWADVNGVRIPVTKNYHKGWVNTIRFGAYVNGELKQICKASGIDEDTKKAIKANPDAFLGKVAKVTFMERTEAGYPRHPNFEGIHEDKRPDECIWDFDLGKKIITQL